MTEDSRAVAERYECPVSDFATPEPRLAAVKAVPPIPDYLQETYWWAYLHPRAVKIFEHQWIVNLILWGNFARLRDLALDELGTRIPGRTLQVACVYGVLSGWSPPRWSPQRADSATIASSISLASSWYRSNDGVTVAAPPLYNHLCA